MSSPAGMPQGFAPQLPSAESQGSTANMNSSANEDGVSVKPMRLKVLYTFDDQNKTNCLARWPPVLQVQTVAMDETTSIGVIELKTCIQAIVTCSPELVARLGQDYTVYAYDYSEYDNPLVGQGMLSWALAAASTSPDVPAHQSTKLVTGRVCKNIMGLFSNGVKETLEVKLRLVPVPTVLQSEYISTMEKYRELSKVMPAGFDPNEWTSFLQSNPSLGQLAKATPAPNQPTQSQRDGSTSQSKSRATIESERVRPTPQMVNTGNESQNESAGPAKKGSRPSSRAAVKRPRKPRQPKNIVSKGGNTSGYEEGTDGDDGPQPKKRAKITKTDWNSKSTIGAAPDSLRVAASTAGSLRLFRPIAMSPVPGVGSHLQEIPRAPTPVPRMANQHSHRDPDKPPPQSSLRRNSFLEHSQIEAPRRHVSPYPPLENPEDQPRYSIESANVSPERNPSPSDTPPDIGSSPPVMRTRAPSMRSSPPCPSSPVLPQMPRTDSGFMSGSLEDLFGEDYGAPMHPVNEDLPGHAVPDFHKHQAPTQMAPHEDSGFFIEWEEPGPMELLPTKMHIHPAPVRKSTPKPRASSKAPKPRAGSVMSEDGQQSLPPLRKDSCAISRPPSQPQQNPQPSVLSRPVSRGSQTKSPAPQQRDPRPDQEPRIQSRPGSRDSQGKTPVLQDRTSQPPESKALAQNQDQATKPPSVPRARAGRTMSRTASMGSLHLPIVPASDPAIPPSGLQRSQTWSEAPITSMSAIAQTYLHDPASQDTEYDKGSLSKKASIRHKLEQAIAKGEMPPYCSNCGAIETPTWRKAWYQEHDGNPGYHDYSEAAGRVTCINVLNRDSDGKPTSYQLIKKSLGKDDSVEDYKEFLLCNPCGIWMAKYKTQRPESQWVSYQPVPRKGADPPPKRQRPPKKSQQNPSHGILTSEANFPTSDANFPQSEANFPPSDAYQGQGAPTEGNSPTETEMQTESMELSAGNHRRRSTSNQPLKRALKAMTSDAASAALARAIQSSPGRWHGTQQSPIDVEDQLGSTRRLLFPSPRKDGSPKVLGEVMTNVVQIATDLRPLNKEALVALIEATDKENCPPGIEVADADAELLRLFEEEVARPSTPTQKSPPTNPFKTPTRKTPSHRPITRSVSKSSRSQKSPRELLFAPTPSKTPISLRRSPRFQNNFESPFTARLNQMMSETNQSPSRALEFSSLPNLPNLMANGTEMNFNLEDFFSTDVPMPSSPPRIFQLYEDPMVMQDIDWSELGNYDGGEEGENNGVVVKKELESEVEGAEKTGES
ncbi:CENP-A multicopy suppressor protein [Lachnellula hyalina]|uniref:CENP-A multicopy suppressor protein n=1 Tax=Lachnellula hyalina TaxID=1316788 RepID=A0A8H8R0Y9_9HELO|nr:CENP-A multicopy suppressor protein [Lachnellula hyalina]TVY25760.1 CENP-A multicopy suppressor protein [Lachnellula hyalina]